MAIVTVIQCSVEGSSNHSKVLNETDSQGLEEFRGVELQLLQYEKSREHDQNYRSWLEPARSSHSFMHM